MHNLSLIQKDTPYRLTISNTLRSPAQIACYQQPRTLTFNQIVIFYFKIMCNLIINFMQYLVYFNWFSMCNNYMYLYMLGREFVQ
jgi:hypothetical protein